MKAKQAEIASQLGEEQLKAILNELPFPISLKDCQGRYLHANAAYLWRLGIPSLEQIKGKTDEQLNLDGQLTDPAAEIAALSSFHPISYERAFPYPNGEKVDWITQFALRDAQGQAYALCSVLVDVTPLKETQWKLHQAAERDWLLGSLLRRIRQVLDLKEILQTTVAEVRQLLEVDRVMIYQLQEPVGGFIVAESVADPWPSHLGRFVWDSRFQADPCYQKYREGFVQALGDVETAILDPCYRELLQSFQAKANLAIPIRHQDKLWGLLVAQHCLAPRPWQAWEIKLLQELTDQLAVALQQAELYEQLQAFSRTLEQQVQQRTAELQRSLQFELLVQSITEHIRDSLDEAEILSVAVQELGESLGVDGCAISLYNDSLTLSTIRYEYCPHCTPALHGLISMVGGLHDDLYRQLTRGQSAWFCFILPPILRPEMEGSEVLACPLVDKDRVLGDLWVFRRRGDTFDEQETRLVRQVASQCAVALRQARLFDAAQEQVRALERLNRLKDDFISSLSHELRTPITSLKMALRMLQTAPTEEKRAQYLGIAEKECRRQIELINDLLDLQRLQAKSYALDFQTVTWKALLGDLLETARERAQAKQQNFQAGVPTEAQITTDPLLLGRILRELLDNAFKHTPRQGSIRLKVESHEHYTHIEVRNSQEIPAEELKHIFELFYRIPGQDPWKEGGTGLGLALVKQMVDQLRGSLEVSSEDGWTTFTLNLPHLPSLVSNFSNF